MALSLENVAGFSFSRIKPLTGEPIPSLLLSALPGDSMRHSHISVTLLLAAILAGCATSKPVNTPQASTGQTALQQALARESTLSGSYAVADEDHFFSANVSSSARPTVTAHEGVYQITVPIAAEIPAECFVYHESLDAAATLNMLINEPLSSMPKTQILEIDAGTFGHRPYLYQEKLYITDQQVAGVLKGIVVTFETSMLACLHDSAGYSETFTNMAASFADKLVLHGTTPETWAHEEVLLWKLRDMHIGFTINRSAPDDEGDIKSTVETALMIPRSSSEAITHDEYNITYEQPDGVLINGRYAEAENGAINVNISLDRTAQGGYQVEGVFQGKEISAPLQATSRVVGPYHQYQEMIRAANPASGQPHALTLDAYVPSANPLQTISMDMNPTGAHIGGLPEYDLLFAGLKASGVVDDRGQKSMTVKMGLLELKLSRAYINSQP